MLGEIVGKGILGLPDCRTEALQSFWLAMTGGPQLPHGRRLRGKSYEGGRHQYDPVFQVAFAGESQVSGVVGSPTTDIASDTKQACQ
jgi:hypothetical protein